MQHHGFDSLSSTDVQTNIRIGRENKAHVRTRPKHVDCLGRFSLGPTIPIHGDLHTAESRDFPYVTPLQHALIACGRSLSPARLSRINLVAGSSAFIGRGERRSKSRGRGGYQGERQVYIESESVSDST